MENIVEGPVVALYAVVESRMAVHGLSSELRNPAVVDTCWVGLALTWYLPPSQNVVVQGSEWVRPELGP
jgi:hypothetical protein